MSEKEAKGVFEVIEHVSWTFRAYQEANNPILQASYLIELSNAIADLESWHPKFNIETGEIEE